MTRYFTDEVMRRKYGNIRTEYKGYVFASKAEARRAKELDLLLAAGEIRGYGKQPSFLLDGGVRYRPDFIVCDKNGIIWVEDVKGHKTEGFRIKEKLFHYTYPWMELRILK